MRPLFLDYRRDNPAQHRIGMLALALEVVAVLAMGTYYHKVSGQAAHLEEQVAQGEHKLHPGRSGARTSAASAQQAGAEIKVANDVIMRLSLPWSELFNALEEANSSNIALLGIEPDAGKKLVRVSGEAKDSAALFAYIRILQANKAMTSVYLKHQQVQEHNPERPIRFTLDASWT